MFAMIWCLLLLCSPANAAKNQAYYETRELRLTLPANIGNYELRETLKKALQRAKIKVVALEQSDGSRVNLIPRTKGSPKFKKLSYATVIAALVPLSHELKGAEVDVFVADKKKQLIPVSIWWDAGERTFVMREGPVVETVFLPAPKGVEVVETFGTGPLVGVGREWSSEARGLLYKALSLLSEKELRYLQDIPFHREAKASEKMNRALLPAGGDFSVLEAVYAEKKAGPYIAIFDAALKVSGRFAGEPDAPNPPSLLTLVHEMGHAFARYHARQMISSQLEKYALFEKTRESYNQLLDERNHIYEKNKKSLTPVIVKRLNKMDSRLDKLQAKVQTQHALIQAQSDAIGSGSALTPVAAEMLKVLGKQAKAPTLYGRTKGEEAFADCFALYFVDPRALKRAAPEVHDWFARGEHLKVMRDSVPPDHLTK